MRVHFQHLTSQFVRRAPEHLRTVDGILLPQGVLATVPAIDLYEDRWVCVVSVESAPSADSAPMTPAELAARPWVMPYSSPWFALPPLHWLRARGMEPRLELTSESFLSVPHLVAGTDRVGVVPERAARLFPADAGTVLLDLPFGAGPLVESLWWHPIHEREPAHMWLREMVSEAAQLIPAL